MREEIEGAALLGFQRRKKKIRGSGSGLDPGAGRDKSSACVLGWAARWLVG